MPQVAPGLPNPEQYGDTSKLPVGELIRYAVQKHMADRAKLHHDVRLGTPDTGLLSWAVRKGIPQPGQKHLAVQQPIHDYDYGEFQGEIPSGYGKGKVEREDLGEVLVTRSSPNAVHFTVAHKGVPERFVLAKTGYGRDGRGWLLMNVTPTKPLPYDKKRYTLVPPDKAEQIIKEMPPGTSVQPKIDGAHVLMPILKDRIETISYRTSKRTGGPIFHTERVFHGIPNPHDTGMPAEYRGSVLRGELYGVHPKGEMHPMDIGGILNAGVGKSMQMQKDKNINLRTALFDVEQFGKKKVTEDVPYPERMEMLKKLAPYLPKEPKVHVVPEATTSQSALKLFQGIREGKNPLTNEGIVIHPPTGRPMKSKLRDEYDVHIHSIFPGEGKYQGTGAGGFYYSLQPGGPPVGKVGTGFDDAMRRELWQNQQDYVGRVAKVFSQEQLRSGALRAPAFHSLHEEYPSASKTAGSRSDNKTLGTDVGLAASGAQAITPEEVPNLDRPNWVKHVMETSFATDPPKGIFTKSPRAIVRAGDLPGVAPKGLVSWLRMVNFHRNRGGVGLSEERRQALAQAIQLLTKQIEFRKKHVNGYDPVTLLNHTS